MTFDEMRVNKQSDVTTTVSLGAGMICYIVFIFNTSILLLVICAQVDGPGRWYFAYGPEMPAVGVRVGVVRRGTTKNRHSTLTNSLK